MSNRLARTEDGLFFITKVSVRLEKVFGTTMPEHDIELKLFL